VVKRSGKSRGSAAGDAERAARQHPWSVRHHLPGRRYGKITIQRRGESVAHMVADNDEMLAIAQNIVAVLNARLPR
jgi:hypothetical protein